MPATQTEASGRPAAHRGELLSSSKQVYPSAGLGSQRQAKVNKAHSLALNEYTFAVFTGALVSISTIFFHYMWAYQASRFVDVSWDENIKITWLEDWVHWTLRGFGCDFVKLDRYLTALHHIISPRLIWNNLMSNQPTSCCLIWFHLISKTSQLGNVICCHLTASHLKWPHLLPSHLRLTSISPLISSHLESPHLISQHLVSFHLLRWCHSACGRVLMVHHF